eukprot:gene18309-23377_t
MAAAIWSSSPSDILQFPATTFLRFCLNHALLQVNNRPQWRTVQGGARNYVSKIAASLRRQGVAPPAPSTITAILHRHGEPMVAAGRKVWKRFEHAEPNAMWQMDFKGDVPFGGGQLHPLTVVDDHSRYAVVLQAADNQRRATVQSAVQAAFERYGLPEVILTDNGPPW